MSNDLEIRLDRLEESVARLEYREGRIRSLLDSRTNPWAFFVLEHDLSVEQCNGITEVMDAAHKALEQGAPVEGLDFEKQLIPYMSAKDRWRSSMDFVKCLLMTFDQTGQWRDVVEQFRTYFNVTRMDYLKRLP